MADAAHDIMSKFSNEADEAFERADYRVASKMGLDAFYAAPDRWDPLRWAMFHGYTNMVNHGRRIFSLRDKPNFVANLEPDRASLEAILEDKKELKLYRIEAAFSLGMLLNNIGKREEAADCFRKAVELKERVPKQEKRHKVIAKLGEETGVSWRRMEEVMEPIVDDCKDWLHRLLGGKSNEVPSETSRYTALEEKWKVGDGFALRQQELKQLIAVGGERCDCCGKSREELGLSLLDICARCKKAYYCGRVCQAKQWKAGHKKHCRKPGEFKPGDHVVLTGLQSKPELNRTLVEIIGEDPRPNGRWEVKVSKRTKTISVSSENMEQLRPLK